MNHFSEQSQINERLAKLFTGKVSSFHYVCTIASLGSGTAKMAHKMAQESGRSKDLGKTKFTYVSKASVGKTPLFGVKFHPNVDGAYFATAGDNQVTVYQCAEDGTIKPEHSFVDGDVSANLSVAICICYKSSVT
jgi:hypothetical protein